MFLRYYSNSVQGYLHRTFALKEWSKFQKGVPIPLERALAAYDMFILHDSEGDFEFVGDASLTACRTLLSQT